MYFQNVLCNNANHVKPTKGEMQCNYPKQIEFYVLINIEPNKQHNHKSVNIAVAFKTVVLYLKERYNIVSIITP